MRKQHVLIFTHVMAIGGVERSLIGMLRCMNPDEVEVDLQLLENTGELLDQVPPWVRVLPAPAAYNSLIMPVSKIIFTRGFPIALMRIMANFVLKLRKSIGLPPGFLLARSHRYSMPFIPRVEGEYDLAISYMMPHDFVARKVCSRKKVGWIHTDYTSVESGVAVDFEVKAWQQMNQVISISKEVTASMIKVFPQLERRIILIENILDPNLVREKSTKYLPAEVVDWPRSPMLTFCSVGRLTHQKGFDIAIEAAYKLRLTGLDFRWYVIGYGPDKPMLRKLITRYELGNFFILLGPHENPYPIMKACDLYIQPSRYEGKAVSIREAQILGKAVLVSDFATVGSQISHLEDGFITPSGVDGLFDGILTLVNNSELRTSLSEAAMSRDYGNLSEIDKVMALVPKINE